MGMHIRKGGKFMKLKKKSGLMGAVIALSAASLVSVGFASWVISQGDDITAEGTILVDKVENRIHLIDDENSGWLTALDGSIDNSKNKIVYGASDDALASEDWLQNDGKLDGTGAENSSKMVLKAWYKIKVTNVTDDDKYSDIIKSVVFEAPTQYTDAEGDYVGTFPTPKPYIGGVAATAETAVGTAGEIVYEFEFHWASPYDPDPYLYWTGDLVGTGKAYANEEARRQAAYEWFSGLKTALQGISYSCVITTK